MTIIEGEVVHGVRLGRRLGFPTANIEVGDGFPLADGVYASRTQVDGRWFRSMSNLGCRPSVGGGERLLETYLFDFDGDLYGRRIRVEMIRKLRDERRFDSIDELSRQLRSDYEEILTNDK